MRAVDSSYDLLTREEARYLKEHGWPVFIQCLLALPYGGSEQPLYRIESLRNAQAEGLELGAYIAIGDARPGNLYIDQARGGVPDDLWEALRFVAVDVEVPGIPEDEIWRALNQLAELGKPWDTSFGVIPQSIIYTSYNVWMNYVHPSNPTSFSNAGVGLWNAYHDGDDDVDFSSLPFGGWTEEQVAIEQWSGGTYVGRQFVDRNTIPHPELLNLGGEHMPTQEYDELKSRLDGLQELVHLGLTHLTGRAEGLEDGTTEVPIWPVGDVSLQTIRHRGYHHAGAQVEQLQGLVGKLRDAMWEAKNALANHINMHNSSGGAQDSSSIPFIDDFSERLDEIEREMNNLE